MLFKVGEIRPYVIGTVVSRGKIIKVAIEDLKTKKQHIVAEEDVFIGDD